jgi:hypothetical protein
MTVELINTYQAYDTDSRNTLISNRHVYRVTSKHSSFVLLHIIEIFASWQLTACESRNSILQEY